MKRLAVLCSVIGLSFLGASTVSAQTITSPDENWVLIPLDSLIIPIPTINFQAQQVNESQYELSWNNQSGATSYKIERQSVDYFVNNQSLTIPTKWTELTNTTETNFTVDHDLLSFDMGGHQNFRLSKCVDTTCEVLAQLNYFLLAKEHQNTIPQNFTITSDTRASAF